MCPQCSAVRGQAATLGYWVLAKGKKICLSVEGRVRGVNCFVPANHYKETRVVPPTRNIFAVFFRGLCGKSLLSSTYDLITKRCVNCSGGKT